MTLREREAQGRAALSTTLRSIGDAVIATDAAGRVHFMNPLAESLTAIPVRKPKAARSPKSSGFRTRSRRSPRRRSRP
jgi:PAS domain-containing protein